MFGSPANGNYMGILELVGQYDSFLATHIEKYGNPGYEQITGDPEEKQITRQEAKGLSNEFHKLETGILITLWDTVLQRFTNTSKALQCATLDLNNAVSLLNSLQDFVSSLRSEFDDFEEQGKELSETNTYEEETRRKQKRKKQFDESSGEETRMSRKEKFRVEVFLRIIDHLNTALVYRASANKDISSKFGFLSKVMTMDRNSLKHHCDLLVNHYPSDIETSFSDEMIHFASYAAANINDFRNKNENHECSTELIVYRMLLQHGLKEVFPNVEIAYRLYLCLMVSNCTGERSFSKLKLIKDET
ncbi:uncharacterized protein [Macrobrachium rosenbergii]|uniref:uncharacterized protein n=1 Tax=Macrobrachium rosenbergii TaxID=79674 RepID=UPI0034D6626F